MGEVPTDPAILKARFERHGIAMRHLNPWWVRAYRWMGLNPRPPVLFSLGEHLRWESTSIALVTTVGCLLSWWLYGTNLEVLPIFYAMAIVIPLINWRIRTRIRRRIAD